MAKKLTLEVDAETSKAKRKIQELADTGGAGGGGSDAVSQSADKAAKSLNKLGDAAQESNASLRASVKVFAGMAVHMATAQAAQSMPEGSAGRTAINAGGAAIAGALQGSVAGPLGALAGATMGLATALMQANAEEKARVKALEDSAIANRKQLEEMEEADKRSEEFKKKLKDINSIEDVGKRRAALDEAIKEKQNYYDTEIYGHLREASSVVNPTEGQAAEFQKWLKLRAENKSEISQLTSSRDGLDMKEKFNPAFRASIAAADSLTRLGGNFGGGGDVARDQLKTQQEQLNVLKRLEEKQDKKGATTWQ